MIPQNDEVQRRKVLLQIAVSGSAPAAVHQESVVQPNLTSAQILFLIIDAVEKEYSLSSGRFVSAANLWTTLMIQKLLIAALFPPDYFLTNVPTELFLQDLRRLIDLGAVKERSDNGLMINSSSSAAYRRKLGVLPAACSYVVPQLIRRMKRSCLPPPVHHMGIEHVDVAKLK